jgi:FkbM family methyltransferase
MKIHTNPGGSKSKKGFPNLVLNLAALAARFLPLPIKRGFYRVTPFARFVRYGLNRVAPQGLVQVNVAAGELAGMRMLLDLQLEKDYWLGTYEPELLAAITDVVRPGMVAYDLGANIGYVTLMLAKMVGDEGHVYAFEALPENVKRLVSNISLNGMERRVTARLAAVASHSGQANFLVGPSIGTGKVEGSAGREEVVYPDSISVQSVALDDFVYLEGNQTPDIIKMDIEGGEVLALSGMERLLTEKCPLILLELHGFEAAKVVWGGLLKADYRIYRMKPGLPPICSLEELDWKAYLVAKPLHDVVRA